MAEATGPRELSDWEFGALVLRTLGAARAARLVGFCVLWRLLGMRNLGEIDAWAYEMRKAGGPSRAVIYRVVADLRLLHVRWAEAEGREPRSTPSLEAMAKLAERIAVMQQPGVQASSG
jgi:hypothetical protein